MAPIGERIEKPPRKEACIVHESQFSILLLYRKFLSEITRYSWIFFIFQIELAIDIFNAHFFFLFEYENTLSYNFKVTQISVHKD